MNYHITLYVNLWKYFLYNCSFVKPVIICINKGKNVHADFFNLSLPNQYSCQEQEHRYSYFKLQINNLIKLELLFLVAVIPGNTYYRVLCNFSNVNQYSFQKLKIIDCGGLNDTLLQVRFKPKESCACNMFGRQKLQVLVYIFSGSQI